MLAAIRARQGLVSLLLAIVLTVVAYPSVVFLGGSLAPAGLNTIIDRNAGETVRISPVPDHHGPSAGLLDPGARVWQLDPATKFMERVIHDGEGVGWNPYSAAGMLGPETLADMKLSPFVVIVAFFGASSTAFTFVLLAFVVVALYCLQQLFVRSLGMHRLAAIAACLAFVIGGWGTMTLTSQMGAPYLLFPIVLYTLIEFLRRTGPARLLLAVAAYAALLLTTFVPALVLVLLFVHSIALVVDLTNRSGEDDDRPIPVRTLLFLGRQAIVPIGAVAVTAFMWLPTIDAYRNAGSDITGYGRREPLVRHPIETLSMLTPRHLFRTYRGDQIPAHVRDNDPTVWIGLVPLLLVAGALPRSRGLSRRLVAVCIVLGVIAVGQHLMLPVLSEIGDLPVLRSISAVYWASLTAAAIVIAVGVGVDTALRRGLSLPGVAIAGAALVAAFGIGVLANWRPDNDAIVNIAIGLALIAAVVVLAWQSRGDRRRVSIVVALSVAVMFVELYSYQNPNRVRRFDYEDSLPPYLTFVQDNLGDGRVLNVGRSGMHPDSGNTLGIRQAGTMNVMQVPEYRQYYIREIYGGRSLKFLALGRDRNIPFRAKPGALDNLAVRYIIVTDDMRRYGIEVADQYPLVFDDRRTGVRVFENVDAFPRVYLAGALAPFADVRQQDEPWRVDRPFTRDEKLLDTAAAAGIPEDVGGPAPGTARLVDDGHTRLEVEVDAERPAVLVVSDAYHPNWSATVNGQSAHVGRVNHTLRGLVVPEGRSVVELEYHSPERAVGTAASVASAVVLVLACAVWAVRRRRADRSAPSEQVEPAEEVGRSESVTVG